MKKYIQGKKYDTATAKLVGAWGNGCYTTDFNYLSESLYRKRTGEYFIHGEGGARTHYAEQEGSGWWSGGEAITPISPEDARQWAEEHLSTDEYDAEFGEPTEGDEHVITVAIAESNYRAIREYSIRRGISMGAVVDMLCDGTISTKGADK